MGGAELEGEPSPRLVVAGVGAEEAFVRAGQLLATVCLQRLDLLVVCVLAVLLLEPVFQVAVVCEALAQLACASVEAVQGGAEDCVQQPDLNGVARAYRGVRTARW